MGKAAATAAWAQASSVRRLVGAAVHRSAVWCCTTACVHVPIHSRSTAGPLPCVQWPRCQRFAIRWGPARPPTQHPWPFVSSVSTATSECIFAVLCSAVRVCFFGDSVKPCGCYRSPLVRVVSAFSVVLCCKVWVRAHESHAPTYRARASARAQSTHPSLPLQRASPSAHCSTFATAPASIHR